jgi:hypothetical protein
VGARGRPLVLAVRDARRTAALIGRVLAARPETVIVEMGVPAWTPPPGTAYLATYGASRACAQAAAEALGLGPCVSGGLRARPMRLTRSTAAFVMPIVLRSATASGTCPKSMTPALMVMPRETALAGCTGTMRFLVPSGDNAVI